MTDNHPSRQKLFQTMALTTLLVGAIGSFYFMFKAGSSQRSIILIGLFTVWVLSPFVGLFIANKITSIRTAITRRILYWLMPGLTIVSLIAYSGLVTIPDTKPAFIFLAFPFVSWFVILTIFLIARQHKQKT